MGARWTEDEKSKLVWVWDEYMGKVKSQKAIAEQMGRSWESCSFMARSLGLRRTANGKGLWNAKQVAKVFGINHRTVTNLLYDGAFDGVDYRCDCRTPYAISYHQLEAFVEKQKFWHLWSPQCISDEDLMECAKNARKGWLSRAEAANSLGITPARLSQLRSEGHIKGVTYGHVTWYTCDDVIELGVKRGWIHG